MRLSQRPSSTLALAYCLPTNRKMRAWLSGLWVENGEMRLVYYGDANEKRPNGGGVDYGAV